VDNAAILTDAWDHPTRSGKAHNALTGIAFAPIPEPASLALLGLGGLLALAGLGRRRSR